MSKLPAFPGTSQDVINFKGMDSGREAGSRKAVCWIRL